MTRIQLQKKLNDARKDQATLSEKLQLAAANRAQLKKDMEEALYAYHVKGEELAWRDVMNFERQIREVSTLLDRAIGLRQMADRAVAEAQYEIERSNENLTAETADTAWERAAVEFSRVSTIEELERAIHKFRLVGTENGKRHETDEIVDLKRAQLGVR